MKLITALTVISTAFFVAWTRYRLQEWETYVEQLEQAILLGQSAQSPLVVKMQQQQQRLQCWENLPPIVQRYFKRVLPEEDRVIRSLTLQQEGSFDLGNTNSQRWGPFRARQVVSTNPPGFVWEATMSMHPSIKSPTIQVLDAWAGGLGHMKAAFMKVLTVAQVESSKELVLGEALRWLAESFLVPTVLLPDQAIVTWTATTNNNNKALLQMEDPNHEWTATLEVTFDPETGLVKQVNAERPAWDGGSFVLRPWQGHFLDYKEQMQGIWIPTRMECGWIDEKTGELKLYFKGENSVVGYDINAVSSTNEDYEREFYATA